MNFQSSISNLRSSLGKLIAGKSWRSLWGAGLDGSTSEAAELRRPYEQSVWVFRAIQTVAMPIASMPLKFTRPGDSTALTDPEREQFWSRPARSAEGTMSRNDFIEATVAWLQLEGQAFWILDDTWLRSSGMKTKSPLLLVRPDRVRPIHVGGLADGALLGWEFTDGAGKRTLLLPEQVARPRFFNPYDPLKGLAPWRAAKVAAEADFAAGVFARNLSKNNGDRGAYVIAKSGVVDDAQRQQIESMLREKREQSRRGVYKTAFLTGDISVEDPKVQSVDAAFINQRLEHRHEIFIAFGVPASMCDVTASYSVGSASDRYRLIEDTCQPIGAKLCEHIERVETMRSGVELQACFDWSNHSVMQQVRAERATTAEKLWKMGMPMEEVNEYLQLGLPDYEGNKKAWLPMNLQEVGAPEEEPDETPQPPAPKPEEEDSAAAQAAFTRAADSLTSILSQSSASSKAAKDESEELWLKHMALRAAAVKAFKAQLTKTIAEARAETLANLEEKMLQRGLLDLIFDLGKFTVNLWLRSKGVFGNILATAAEQFSEELGLDDPWKMEDPNVMAFMGSRESKIKDAGEHIWHQVKDTINEGLEKGESNAKIAGRVREAFNGISKERAEMIAQTEVSAAYGGARQLGMEQTGVSYKKWLTARDEKVRASHLEVDGDIIPVPEKFTVGDSELMHPGDPHGSAAEVINCRCVCVAARKPKE